MASNEIINAARVTTKNGVPYSLDYKDIYHDPNFVWEVEKTLLGPSGLMPVPPRVPILRVAELGFGTALNFAALAKTCINAGQPLHFVTCDITPIEKTQFAAITKTRIPQFPIYEELIETYPPLIKGWHRRHLSDGDITLSCYWGSAADAMTDLANHNCAKFDAWFLDGFSPKKNPDMWKPSLLAQLARLSGNGTTVASFTSAGYVRRSLQKVGFDIRLISQMPKKRSSLAGVYRTTAYKKQTYIDEVAVVGAGIAGATVANRLANYGINVTVYEKNSDPATGGSSIPASILHPRLLTDGSNSAKLRCLSYQYSAAKLRGLGFEPTGAIQIPNDNTPLEKLEEIARLYQPTGDWVQLLEQPVAEKLSKWTLSSPALWFPFSLTINMPTLCQKLLDHSKITVEYKTDIKLQNMEPNIPVVLACANSCRDFKEAHYLELQSTFGQIDSFLSARLPAIPIIGSKYMIPIGTSISVGATYENPIWEKQRATKENLQYLQETEAKQAIWINKWRGERSTSSDRIPIVGNLFDTGGNLQSNLFTSLAMGSMGNTFSHFSAEIIASMIAGEFPPLTTDLLEALSPLRFRQRQARRGYRNEAKP